MEIKDVFVLSLLVVILALVVSMQNAKEVIPENPILYIDGLDNCEIPKGSGSMLPLIYNDTIVCTKKLKDPIELSDGDIIIFKWKEKRVIHRIVNMTNGFYLTKGDNNDVPDDYNVSFKDIEGKVVFAIFK